MTPFAFYRSLAQAIVDLIVRAGVLRPPTARWQDKRRRGAARSVGGFSRGYKMNPRGAPRLRSLRNRPRHWLHSYFCEVHGARS